MRKFVRTAFAVSAATIAPMVFNAGVQASVEISGTRTKNMHCAKGVCAPTAKRADLNISDLTNMLAAGDVKIVTGSGAVTITVVAPFSWTSAHRLTLDAAYNVSFRAPVAVAGNGAVTIITNDGGTGGDLIFFPEGKLDFWDLNSSLIINGKAYVLLKDVSTLDADVRDQPSGLFAFARHYNAANHPTEPIKTEFVGEFEGLGHTISNLKVALPFGNKAPVGLFREIGTAGIVRDIALLNETVTSGAGRPRVGGVAAISNGAIRNVSADVTLTSGYEGNTGGLVGYNAGVIIGSHASGSIKSAGASSGHFGFTGGLVGYNTGTIDRSYEDAGVDGGGGHEGEGNNYSATTGGLVGINWGGTITQSFSSGSVKAGGLSYVGGLIGTNASSLNLHDCYSVASVEGANFDSDIGGLIGENEGPVATSYSTGLIAVQGGTNEVFVGGFFGEDFASPESVTAAYWDLDTSGIGDTSQGAGYPSNDPGITGLSDSQLKSGLPQGFDPSIWGQSASINNGYPYLLANPPPQ